MIVETLLAATLMSGAPAASLTGPSTIDVATMAAAVMQTAPTDPVKNPTKVQFTCPDHDRDDQHELDIVRVSDGQVIQTLLLGDPAADANGVVTATVNVQPIAFGDYVVRIRALAGSLKSVDSPDSNVFERVPGAPSKATLQ